MKKNKKKYSLKSQAGHILIGKLIGFVVRFFVPVILVRLFTQNQYGIYKQILLISAFVIPIFRFGLPNSLFFFFQRQQTKKDLNELITRTFFSEFVLSVLMFLILFIFRNSIISLMDLNSVSSYIIYVIIFIFLMLISFIIEVIFIVEEKPKIAMIYFIANPLTRAILLILAVLLFKTVRVAVFALIIYSLIKTVILFVYLRINYEVNPFIINVQKLKDQFTYVLPMGISALIGTIGNYADKIILAALLTSKEFAIYSVGLFKIPLIILFYISVGNVVLPKISSFSLNQENDKTLRLWKKMIVKNALVTIPFICFFIVISESVIIFLFTEQYVNSVLIFRITLISLLIQMLGYGYILRGYGETKKVLRANLIKMFSSVILGFFFIKYFGIIGAAISYTLAFSINGIIQLIYSKKILKVKFCYFLPWLDFIKLFIISIVPISLILTLKTLNFSNFLFIIFSGVIYFSSVGFLLMRYNYLSLPKLTAIKKFIGF